MMRAKHSRKEKQPSLFLRKFSLSEYCTFLLNPLRKLIYSEMFARKGAIWFIGGFFPLNTLKNDQTKWQDLLVVYGRTYLMRHISLVRKFREHGRRCVSIPKISGDTFLGNEI